jgi:hypothetical protein
LWDTCYLLTHAILFGNGTHGVRVHRRIRVDTDLD